MNEKIPQLKSELEKLTKNIRNMEKINFPFICERCELGFSEQSKCPQCRRDTTEKIKVLTGLKKYKVLNETKLKQIQRASNFEIENLDLNEIAFKLSDFRLKPSGIYDLASYLLYNRNIITVEDAIYVFDAGVYVPGGEKILGNIIQKELKLNELITVHVLNEFLGYVKRHTYLKFEKVKEPEDKICLQNGILNLSNLQVEDHNPEIIFFNKIPVIYDPEADCPNIMKFLKEVVPEDSIPILQELAGYCLYKSHSIHKAFMLVGSGGNGKSTFISLLKTFLGPVNCSAIPLQQLEGNRFASSNLFGKLANLFADLPARALKETAMFKMLTGQDMILGEKKFKDGFHFENYAKLIFSCNRIPKSPDDSDAFFRRWIIINFPNQFIGKKADKKLLSKLTTQEELSGFLNFAIEGLKRLLENGDFSQSESIEKVREEYIRQSDSIEAFIMDKIQISPEDYISKSEIYLSYCDYCRNKNYPMNSENQFHKEIPKKVRVEDYRPLVGGKRIRCWKGLKLEKNMDMVDNMDTKRENVRVVQDVQANSLLRSTETLEIENINLSSSDCAHKR